MSEESDSQGPERATVALAVSEIRGLHQLTRAEFTEVNRRLDKLEGLPERVTRIEATQAVYLHLPDAVGGVERVAADHEHRIIDLERDRETMAEGRRFGRVHWPTLIPALLALLVALLAVYISYKFH